MESILSRYKYKSQDNSYVSKLYHPMWVSVEKNISNDIHPNIITFFGLSLLFFTYNKLLSTTAYFYKFLFSMAIFLYMNLDAVDGIHARRTKKTSVLGEICDHLCDCISNGLVIDGLLLCLNIKELYFRYIATSIGSLFFIFANYQAMKTGVMKFEAFSDTSLILTVASLLALVSPNLSSFESHTFFRLFFGIANVCAYGYVFFNESDNVLVSFYTLEKFLFSFFVKGISPVLFGNIDIFVLSEIISKKVLNKRVSSYILLIPILFATLDEVFIKYGCFLYFAYYFYTFSKIAKRSVFDQDVCIYYFSTFESYEKDLRILQDIQQFANIVKISILSEEYCEFNFIEAIPFKERKVNLDKIQTKCGVEILDFPNMVDYDFVKSQNIDYVAFDKSLPEDDFRMMKQIAEDKKIAIFI